MDETAQRRVGRLSAHFDVTHRLPRQYAGADGIAFDADALQHLLEHDNHDTRRKMKELMKDELYVPCAHRAACWVPRLLACSGLRPGSRLCKASAALAQACAAACDRRYDINLREERDLAYERLKRICQSGLLSITDFRCACCWSWPACAPRFASALTVAHASRHNPLNIFAAHEVFGFIDGAGTDRPLVLC